MAKKIGRIIGIIVGGGLTLWILAGVGSYINNALQETYNPLEGFEFIETGLIPLHNVNLLLDQMGLERLVVNEEESTDTVYRWKSAEIFIGFDTAKNELIAENYLTNLSNWQLEMLYISILEVYIPLLELEDLRSQWSRLCGDARASWGGGYMPEYIPKFFTIEGFFIEIDCQYTPVGFDGKGSYSRKLVMSVR